MHLTIEKEFHEHNDKEENSEAMDLFRMLAAMVSSVSCRSELIEIMEGFDTDYYEYGFGGNHMWLKEKDADGKVLDSRLAIVNTYIV